MDPRDDQDEGVGTVIARAIADGRAYAQAEIDYWRVFVADRVADAKGLAIFALLALLLVNGAAIALIVGLLLVLTPLVGPALATLIVVTSALLLAGVLGWMAYKRLQHAMRPRSVP